MAVVARNPALGQAMVPSTEPEAKMNVFFRLIDGKTFCLWLDPSISVKTMKEALVAHQRSTGETPSSMVFASKDLFFVWNGKPLDEDMLLSDYRMPSNSTISVSYRNRGGCFMVSLSILTTICAAILGSPCTCGLSLFVVPLLLPLLFVLPLFCL